MNIIFNLKDFTLVIVDALETTVNLVFSKRDRMIRISYQAIINSTIVGFSH